MQYSALEINQVQNYRVGIDRLQTFSAEPLKMWGSVAWVYFC